MRFIKGQRVKTDSGLVGTVKRMYGSKVQVVTMREKLLLTTSFPPRPCGTALHQSTETWDSNGLQVV